MKVLELELQGFGSYAEPCELDLSDVSVCAVVGPNGAGKSTLIDAIFWALYGNVPSRTADDLVCDRSDVARVRIAALIDGDRHTFVRERARGGVSAARWTDACGTETTGARAVTDAATQLLNCDREILMLTAVSRQGDAGRFGAMDPSGRRSVLVGRLVGDTFDSAAAIVDEAAGEAAAVAASSAAEAEAVRAAAAALPEAEATHTAAQLAATAAEARLDELLAASEAAAAAVAQLDAARAAAEERDRHAKTGRESQAAAEAAEARQDELSKQLPALEAAAAEASAKAEASAAVATEAASAAAAAQALAEAAEARLAALDRSTAECDTCSSPLDPDTAERIAHKGRHQIADARAAAETASDARYTSLAAASEADAARTAANEIRTAAAAAASAAAEHRSAAEAADEAHAKAAATAESLEALQTAVSAAPGAEVLAEARTDHNTAQRTLGSAANALASAQTAAEALTDLETAAAAAGDRSTGVGLLRKALQPSGLPHLALESGVHAAAAAANDVLHRMGQVEIRFRCEPDAGEARPPLTIEARDNSASGLWRPYDTFSGGERMKIDIAQRIGWAAVLGVRCRTMWVDEGWGALDSEARPAMARLLHALTTSGILDTFLTISHVPDVGDAFEHRIEVTRGAGGSRAELVAA